MAAVDEQITLPQVEQQSDVKKDLKYLEIVQVTALQSVLYFAKLYEYAKENSGPMKPGVESVEGTVKKVVGPVYEKFHDVPIDFLKFVDQKVDESVTKVESTVPPVLKQASSQAFSAAQKAPEAVRSIASEVKNTGVIGTAKSVYIKYEPTAKELYSKYEPTAEKYAVSTWRSLNKLPIFPQVAQAVVPAASYVSERYNLTVQKGAEKGFTVASYLPLVPTEKIAKLFSEDNVDPAIDANSGGIAAGNPVAAN